MFYYYNLKNDLVKFISEKEVDSELPHIESEPVEKGILKVVGGELIVEQSVAQKQDLHQKAKESLKQKAETKTLTMEDVSEFIIDFLD